MVVDASQFAGSRDEDAGGRVRRRQQRLHQRRRRTEGDGLRDSRRGDTGRRGAQVGGPQYTVDGVERRHLPQAVVAAEEGDGVRDVLSVLRQSRDGGAADTVHPGVGGDGHGPEIAQGREPALGENFSGDVRRGDEDAVHDTAVTENGTVGEREVGLLDVAEAVQQEPFAASMHGRSAPGLVGEGADGVPGEVPAVLRALADGLGEQLAGHGGVGVIEDLHQILAPPQQHAHLGRQHRADGGDELRGPLFDGSERRGGPVELAVRGRRRIGTGEQLVPGRHRESTVMRGATGA